MEMLLQYTPLSFTVKLGIYPAELETPVASQDTLPLPVDEKDAEIAALKAQLTAQNAHSSGNTNIFYPVPNQTAPAIGIPSQSEDLKEPATGKRKAEDTASEEPKKKRSWLSNPFARGE